MFATTVPCVCAQAEIWLHLDLVSSTQPRKQFNINNCAQLLTDRKGIYLCSKGRNEFLCHREMLLVFGFALLFECGVLSALVRFSFGAGEWRDGAEPRLYD